MSFLLELPLDDDVYFSILVFDMGHGCFVNCGNCLYILYFPEFSFKVKFRFLCSCSSTARKWLSDEEMKSLFSFSLSFSAQ